MAVDLKEDKDYEPKSIEECRKRNNWPEWKNAIQTELNYLTKRAVFGSITKTPQDVKPVGYKWVFE